MKVDLGGATIELVEGDITEQDTESIVNAANRSLLGGGGVDGAIHRAGGPEILKECRKLGGCETGDAKMTPGGKLMARAVIHTVGPVYSGGSRGEAELLASCYRRSLEVASGAGLKSVAFPSISTGAYRYPVDEAARVALGAVSEFLKHKTSLRLVRFVLFGKPTYEAYRRAMDELEAGAG